MAISPSLLSDEVHSATLVRPHYRPDRHDLKTAFTKPGDDFLTTNRIVESASIQLG
jgi:hypothetical protein